MLKLHEKICDLYSTYIKVSLSLLGKLALAIYRDFYSGAKLKIFIRKSLIFLIYLLKTLIVSTH